METANKKRIKNTKADLPESANDREHLPPEETTLDLPGVEDIPGQEHVRPLLSGEMADTTISSADEEGSDLLDTDEDKVTGPFNNNSNVTTEEKEMLQQSSESMATPDDEKLKRAMIDSKDEDGTPLNEKNQRSGRDLDVPGSELDDPDEERGEEDEENNSYSLPDEK